MKKNNNYDDQHLASFATCQFSTLMLADLDESWSPNVSPRSLMESHLSKYFVVS